MAQDPVVRGHQRHAEHQRHRQLYPLAKRRILHIKGRLISGADTRCPQHARQKRSSNAADQSPVRQRSNPEMLASQNPARDDEHVVNQRSKCREQKQSVRQQHRRNHSAYVKENLRRQENPSEMNAKLNLLRRKPPVRTRGAHKPAHKLRRKYLRQNRSYNQHRRHHRDDDGKRLLRVRLAVLGQKSRINRDECDRSRASGHDIVEEIRKCKGCYVGVGRSARPVGPGDVGIPRVAYHPRQHHRRNQQQSRRERRVCMRRTEKTQNLRH